tara:strand:+ start:472 stop:804 length:333 start_codon:yes stop_codon:yes gene_type:complete
MVVFIFANNKAVLHCNEGNHKMNKYILMRHHIGLECQEKFDSLDQSLPPSRRIAIFNCSETRELHGILGCDKLPLSPDYFFQCEVTEDELFNSGICPVCTIKTLDRTHGI